jgi:hypothetical protein
MAEIFLQGNPANEMRGLFSEFGYKSATQIYQSCIRCKVIEFRPEFQRSKDCKEWQNLFDLTGAATYYGGLI